MSKRPKFTIVGRRPRFTAAQIRRKVASLARRIEKSYAGADLVLVGILKGGFLFLGDLARELAIPARIDFLRVRSYGNGEAPGKCIEVTKDVEIAAQARLETGTFGICEGCGRSVPLARLRAMPAARTCVACEAREEERAR